MIRFRNINDWLDSEDKHKEKGSPLFIDEWFLGRYQIESYLGFGQTSIVVKALDTLLNRDVVLKIWDALSRWDISPSIILKECRLLANIDHHSIVKVFDYGEISSTRPWAILDYLGNGTLLDFEREQHKGKIKWEVVVDIGIQLTNIIDYLHNSICVFQLDLKPNNISIDPQTNKISLMDLGTAFFEESQNIQIFGTPGYIAPEIFYDHSISKESDIFSFGIILNELLTSKNYLLKIQKEYISKLSLDIEKNLFSRIYGNHTKARLLIDDFSTASIPPQIPQDESLDDFLKELRKFHISDHNQEYNLPVAFTKLLISMCDYDPRNRPSIYEIREKLVSLIEYEKGKTNPKIFISYSRIDKEPFVSELSQGLIDRGLNVWLDSEKLRIGEPFWERIGDAIQKCDFVITVLSNNSINSASVKEEIRTTQLLNLERVKLLPIRIDPINFGDLPINIQSRQILDFVGWEDKTIFDNKINKLAADIFSLFLDNEI